MNNKNLFSIGEVVKAVGITRKILLNYETKGLITPDQKDGTTGRRYYTIDTFTQIRTIRVFQNLGLSFDVIPKYFDDKTDLETVIKLLKKRDELNLTIENLQERTQKKVMLYEKSRLRRKLFIAVCIIQPLLPTRQIF